MVERFTILLDFEVSKLLRRFWTESNWIKSLGVLLAYMDSLDWLNMCVCSVCMMMLFVRSSIIFEAFSFIADSLLLAFYPCDCLIGDFYLLSFLEVLDDFHYVGIYLQFWPTLFIALQVVTTKGGSEDYHYLLTCML